MKKSLYILFVGAILLPMVSFADTTTTTNIVKTPAISPAPAMTPATLAQDNVKPIVQLDLEISKDTKYFVFSLPNPTRLVVDVTDGTAKTEFDKTALANTPVKKVRTAKHGDNSLRIVFDLDKDLAFTTKEEPLDGANASGSSKKRLVISLMAKEQKANKSK